MTGKYTSLHAGRVYIAVTKQGAISICNWAGILSNNFGRMNLMQVKIFINFSKVTDTPSRNKVPACTASTMQFTTALSSVAQCHVYQGVH